jgi:hypothetical protein
VTAEIDSVVLCDAATVREGLLHILGGGITRLWRPTLPAPLALQIAVSVRVGEGDLGVPTDISLQLIDPNGNDLGGAQGGFIPSDPGRMEAGEILLAPLVFDFRNYSVMTYGGHTVKVNVGSIESEITRQFWVLHPDELSIPPVKGLG